MKRKYFKDNNGYFTFLKNHKNIIHINKLYFTKQNNICIVYKLIVC